MRATALIVDREGATDWRHWLLLIITAGSFIAVFSLDPIAQDPFYHQFADQRSLLGIPNWQNVLSNLPFLFVGGAGLAHALKTSHRPTRLSWCVFFIGVGLTCLGSMYYHREPNDQTLGWDRLPMTLSFMGVFVAMLSEFVTPRLERFLLLPFVGLGILSVFLWQQGGDLRLYIWVQGIPMLLIPFLMLSFDNGFTHRRYLSYALICYVISKVLEFSDHAVFALTRGWLGGHALKHLMAALGAWFIYDMLRKRSPRSQSACLESSIKGGGAGSVRH